MNKLHILPKEKNVLQAQMDRLSTFTTENEMQINSKKTKVMLFNTSKKRDFQPEISDTDGLTLEVQEEFQ